MKREDDYIQLKKFLLEEYYYIETKVMEKFILDRYVTEDARYNILIEQINANEILTRFEINHNDIEEINAYDSKSQPDLDLAYWQFGWDIILGKVDYPSPISPQQLELLDESTQQQLLIALGKEMMMVGYELDKRFLEDCIKQVEQDPRSMTLQPPVKANLEEMSTLLGENIRQTDAWLEKVLTLLDEYTQYLLGVELDKKRRKLKYDIMFLWLCEDKIAVKLEEVGRSLIKDVYDDRISWETFNSLLNPDEQKTLAILIGRWNLGCPFSEADQMLGSVDISHRQP